MLVELSSEQEALRETTARFLDDHLPFDAVKRLRDDPLGYDPKLWERGAELGWASLLVSEDNGGGSASGSPLVDLTVFAYELGRRAAPGPLVPVNVVAAALDAADAHLDVLAELMAGTATAAWAVLEPSPHDVFGVPSLEIRTDGDHLVLDGFKRPVDSAVGASHLLVVGRTGEGWTQVLVPADAPGVTVTPLHSVDLTRRFATITFADVRVSTSAVVGALGGAEDQVRHQLLLANVVHNAESVGAMQRAFEMALAWSFDRYSFGRPLASYQEIKHRFADMLSWLEASHAINDAAAAAVDAGAPDAAELVSAAAGYIGEHGAELVQDCVQVHGGIGVTFEHDLHLLLRRVTVNRALYGTPHEHRVHLADLALAGLEDDREIAR
jgi:alkylation response protein AidB-like acyl-CoA dehydrogenase